MKKKIWTASKRFFKITKINVKHYVKRGLIHDYQRVGQQLGEKSPLTEHIWDIVNNNTRSWNIVAGWSKSYFDFKTWRAIFENGYWNVLAEIPDLICFKTKVGFTSSSYNVSASCIIIYNLTVCPFQYI